MKSGLRSGIGPELLELQKIPQLIPDWTQTIISSCIQALLQALQRARNACATCTQQTVVLVLMSYVTSWFEIPLFGVHF